jgi:phosphate-selective porin OprO/OprP
MIRPASAFLLATTMFAGTVPAHAQAQDPNLASEIAALRTEVQALRARVTELESERTAQAAPAPAPAPVPAPAQTAAAPEIRFRGAPQISAPGGWSFKPRGRLQVDAASVSSPPGVALPGLGFSNRLRRGRIGVEGTFPGDFGYRFEVDFANGGVEVADAYLNWRLANGFTVTAGQHDNFQSLEHLTSDLFSSFVERASFSSAFNFERRLGLSGTLVRGPVVASLGVFTDNIADLTDAAGGDADSAVSIDGRLVFAPRIGATQLHFGGSAHWRDQSALADTGVATRYRNRPLTRTSNVRFIGTPALAVDAERYYGLEFALIHGPLHAVAEAHWLQADLAAGPSPTFFGGYAEVGWFLTGETRGYRNGQFDRTHVLHPVGGGGLGALQVNLRYDRLDLNDAGVTGGRQNAFLASLAWIPNDYVRFLVNYGHVAYRGAVIATPTGDRDYAIDVLGARAQFDF